MTMTDWAKQFMSKHRLVPLAQTAFNPALIRPKPT